MTWQALEKDQLQKMLDVVASKGMSGLFSMGSSQANRMSLPFYRDFALYELKNFATLPVFSMRYLGRTHKGGKDFFYLDSSADPIYQVNKMDGGLMLDQGNVMEYLSFFFSHSSIAGEDEAAILRDPETIPYYEYLSDQQKQRIELEKTNAQIDYDAARRVYSVHAPLYYGGSLVKAVIEITDSGEISVKDHQMLFDMNVKKQA